MSGLRQKYHVIWSSLLLALALALPAQADTVEKIKSEGKFVIGYREDTRPFSFIDEAGTPTGYSMDLCGHVAEAVKAQLDLPDLQVEYKKVTSDNRFEMVISGEIDIECGATTNTLTRQEQVSFTLMTFVTGAEFLLPASSQISQPADINDKKIGVLHGTTTAETLNDLIANNGLASQVVTFETHDQGMAALESREIDAYFGDRVLLILLVLGSDNPAAYKLSGRYYSNEPYALMIRRNDDAFRLIADRALAQLYRSGEIGEIYRKWFGDSKPGNLLQALFVLNAIPE
ncbi:MAG: amino acid ABC transporter substrate-binding protein [Pseudomonadota bacterium]